MICSTKECGRPATNYIPFEDEVMVIVCHVCAHYALSKGHEIKGLA